MKDDTRTTTCSNLNSKSSQIQFTGSAIAILSPAIAGHRGAFTPRYPKDAVHFSNEEVADLSAVTTPKIHLEDKCIRSYWTQPPPLRSFDDDNNDDYDVNWLSTNSFRGELPLLEEEEDHVFAGLRDHPIRLQPRKSSPNETALIGVTATDLLGLDRTSLLERS